MQRCDVINLRAEIENQGLPAGVSSPFLPWRVHEIFFLRPKRKPAPATQASVWAVA